MPVNIIATVSFSKHKLVLVETASEPIIERFHILTTFYPFSLLVMDRKMWDTLPGPFKGRINIVLTQVHHVHHAQLPSYEKMTPDSTYFTTFKVFEEFYLKYDPRVFVVGGTETYRTFMTLKPLKPEIVYLTEIYNYIQTIQTPGPHVYMDKLSSEYSLTSIGSKRTDPAKQIEYRFLVYSLHPNQESQEQKYLQLCRHVLEKGNKRVDRTGVGTISVFGSQLHFDISRTVPLLTTKRVAWKHCIEELLWFLRGDTDAKILQKKGVKIWDGNTSRSFLDERGLGHYDAGILGPGYGWNWRFFGAEYHQKYANTALMTPEPEQSGFDQIQYVLQELQHNPYSRRILVSAWNPAQMDEVALMPCHYSFQFYVEQDAQNQKHLSCHFIMRSNDLGCGLPFNLFSYTVLTYILALKTNMKPKSLVYTCSDTHIYSNHVDAIHDQLQRQPTVTPKLWVNPLIKDKDFSQMTLEDFDVVGYYPEPAIRMQMAV